MIKQSAISKQFIIFEVDTIGGTVLLLATAQTNWPVSNLGTCTYTKEDPSVFFFARQGFLYSVKNIINCVCDLDQRVLFR